MNLVDRLANESLKFDKNSDVARLLLEASSTLEEALLRIRHLEDKASDASWRAEYHRGMNTY